MKKKDVIQIFTTLAYLEKDGCYLMLFRNKKANDPNQGKYIGVGGHIEKGETRRQCINREVKEETGFQIQKAHYEGYIDFINDIYPCERMYLYRVTSFSGEQKPCDEGELFWIKKEEVLSLNLWEGDRVFLPLLGQSKKAFHLRLEYQGNQLKEVKGPYFHL